MDSPLSQAEITAHQRETTHQTPLLSSGNAVLTLLEDFFALRIDGGSIWLGQSIGQNLHYAPGYLEGQNSTENPQGKNRNNF